MAEHVLVIGAQKCGTTTLFEDLRSHPDISLAPKESAYLLSSSSAEDYWSRFERGARMTGEVATDYAMLPKIDAASAAARLAPDARIVYIVRNPVDRVISHHHHLVVERRVSSDLATALDQDTTILDNSRYSTQLRPWTSAFGHGNVHVIRFESYMADRQRAHGELCRFLGVPRHELRRPDLAHNTAERKRVATGRWRDFRSSAVYQRLMRPALSEGMRRRIAGVVLPKPPTRPAGPDQPTMDRLLQELEPEVVALAALLGTDPWWSLTVTDAKGNR